MRVIAEDRDVHLRLDPLRPPCAALAAELAAGARAALPDEFVAAVFVDAQGAPTIEPFVNRAGEPNRSFRVDPLEFAAVEHRARLAGRRHFAWFHSHPNGPATPSTDDLATAWRDCEIWLGAFDAQGAFSLVGLAFDDGARPRWQLRFRVVLRPPS